MFFNICFDTLWQQFTLMDCMVDRVESLHAFERGTSKQQKQIKLMLRWQSCSFYGTRCPSSLYETTETSAKRGTLEHPTKPYLRQHDLLSCTDMMKSFSDNLFAFLSLGQQNSQRDNRHAFLKISSQQSCAIDTRCSPVQRGHEQL